MTTLMRVSTYSMHQSTMADVMRLQSSLANLQNQVSSGLKTTSFQGMDGQVETFVQVEAKMQKTQTLLDNNTILMSRLQTTDTVMTAVIDLADEFQDLLIQRQNPASGEALQFEVSARGILKSIAAQLNTSQEGRYLFSGTKTDVPPIKDDIPAPFTSSIPDDLYYQGNNDDIFARVQENFEVQYNVRANEPAFQKLFAAIHLGIDAAGSSDTVNLTAATGMVTEAIDELVSIRAKVQQDMVNIGEINERHEQLNLYWKGFSEKIIKTDLLSASTEVAMGEAILQASFSSFSKLNQLRLTDFLR